MTPMRQWRALLSVPIEAKTERGAWMRATKYANTLTHPGSPVIAGQVEVVAELVDEPCDNAPGTHPLKWTTATRLELADEMIRRWTAFKQAGVPMGG
jgi:hypothetical protein